MHIRFLNIFPIYIFYYKEFICKIRCHKNIAFMLIFIITNCVLMLLYRRKIEKKSDRFNIKNILSLFYYRYFIYIYIYINYLSKRIYTYYIHNILFQDRTSEDSAKDQWKISRRRCLVGSIAHVTSKMINYYYKRRIVYVK